MPRSIVWNGREIVSGIFKQPVIGQVSVRKLGLDGDGQADLTVHGGVEKAVYIYPSEHYDYWKRELQRDLPWGMFGENLTTAGLLENSVRIGDRFKIGTVELIVTQPRFPCYKLGIKFGSMDMVQRFLESGKSGFYLAVLREGEVAAGDPIFLVNSSSDNSIADVFRSQG
jgi:MOSC domain-containing protein YiiM